jgi:hypothetical protein
MEAPAAACRSSGMEMIVPAHQADKRQRGNSTTANFGFSTYRQRRFRRATSLALPASIARLAPRVNLGATLLPLALSLLRRCPRSVPCPPPANAVASVKLNSLIFSPLLVGLNVQSLRPSRGYPASISGHHNLIFCQSLGACSRIQSNVVIRKLFLDFRERAKRTETVFHS